MQTPANTQFVRVGKKNKRPRQQTAPLLTHTPVFCAAYISLVKKKIKEHCGDNEVTKHKAKPVNIQEMNYYNLAKICATFDAEIAERKEALDYYRVRCKSTDVAHILESAVYQYIGQVIDGVIPLSADTRTINNYCYAVEKYRNLANCFAKQHDVGHDNSLSYLRDNIVNPFCESCNIPIPA